MISKKRIHYLCEDWIEKNRPEIHRLASRGKKNLPRELPFGMPNGDSRGRISYPTLTLMIDSYIASL